MDVIFLFTCHFILYKLLTPNNKGCQMFENINKYAESLRKQYGTALLSKYQASKELSISRATLDRMRQDGLIKSQKIGQQVRFNAKEVARVVMGNE